MVKRCAVIFCNNDSRYLDKLVLRGSVREMKWHCFPRGKNKLKLREEWIRAVSKGRKNFAPGEKGNHHVCSNHFIDGEPSDENPIPTRFLTKSEYECPTPGKKKRTTRNSSNFSSSDISERENN